MKPSSSGANWARTEFDTTSTWSLMEILTVSCAPVCVDSDDALHWRALGAIGRTEERLHLALFRLATHIWISRMIRISSERPCFHPATLKAFRKPDSQGGIRSKPENQYGEILTFLPRDEGLKGTGGVASAGGMGLCAGWRGLLLLKGLLWK